MAATYVMTIKAKMTQLSAMRWATSPVKRSGIDRKIVPALTNVASTFAPKSVKWLQWHTICVVVADAT